MFRDTAWFVRQHRLDSSPLVVGEFVAHDSRHRFGGLNHGLPASLNIPCRRTFWSLSARKRTVMLNASFVGHDPKRTSLTSNRICRRQPSGALLDKRGGSPCRLMGRHHDDRRRPGIFRKRCGGLRGGGCADRSIGVAFQHRATDARFAHELCGKRGAVRGHRGGERRVQFWAGVRAYNSSYRRPN